MTADELELRDFFATQFLMMFDLDEKCLENLYDKGNKPDHAWVAKFCYDGADAMLAERARRQTTQL